MPSAEPEAADSTTPAAAAPAAPADVPLPDPALLPGQPAPAHDPSRSFAINLIQRLVQRGALTQKDAEELIALAEADVAAANALATPAAPPPPAPVPAPMPDEVRVTYVPETVRNRLRDEIRDQLRAEAKAEGWHADSSRVEWVDRVEPFADLRLRYEIIDYPSGNDNTGAFPNFNAINTGDPFDIAGTEFSPQYNVDQERQRARIRFRLGAELDLADSFTLGFRVGTGQDNSPVSSNQTLGWANGQGGNFSKYQLWLDRAFIAWEPHEAFKLLLGRFDNPFFSTTNIWSEDIGFDGIAFRLSPQLTENFRPFLSAGAFPVFNTELNFSSNRPDKFESTDKWLYAAQIGAEFKLTDDLSGKVGLAYYYFDNIEGRLSDPYTPLSKNDAGNTDGTRPAFAQKGNTYRPLRNIVPSVLNDYGTSHQYQYFGLATPFRVLAATGRLDYDGWEPVRLSLIGEYAKNTAFNSSDINKIAVNNRGPSSDNGGLGAFEGSDTAWYLSLMVGSPALAARGDWNAYVGYRYIGSDAVVDGFNEQNFGGGGTNLKGWQIGFNYALSPKVYLGARWFSAEEIAGPNFASDIIQIDFGAKF